MSGINTMQALFLLCCMFYLHIVDDFYVQGLLAKLKQKLWWREHYPDSLYAHDWLIALFLHAFSWAFTIMLPITVHMIYIGKNNTVFYGIALCLNICIHAITDHIKANRLQISLLQDQCIHLVQVFITWMAYLFLV